MEIKWLEDFIFLAQVKSFSKAAELRSITQPAFSRRIQSLEMWIGTSLIDRSTFPMELTQAGEYFYEQAVNMIESLNETKSILKNRNSTPDLTIDFAVPHNLSLTFFPEWAKEVSKYVAGAAYRLKALNVHDAVMMLLNGGSDLLVAYSHPCSPLRLDPNIYPSKLLGLEHFSFYGKKSIEDAYEKDRDLEIPYLSYSTSAYLGKVADYQIAKSGIDLKLKKVYETDMAEGLKSMLLAGHGYAFLPQSSVIKELRDGLVAPAFPGSQYCFDADIEIRLFREKQSTFKRDQPDNKHANLIFNLKHKVIDTLWENI